LSGINEINIPTVLGANGLLPDRKDHLDKPFWSTNGDEFLTGGDILLVINALNRGCLR
jgi:hypothetical protein